MHFNKPEVILNYKNDIHNTLSNKIRNADMISNDLLFEMIED